MFQWSKIPETCQLFQLWKNMFENSKRISVVFFCFFVFFNTSLSLGRNSGYITWYNTAAARAVLPILSCHREYILELPFLNWILVSSCSVCYYWPFPHPDEVMVTVDLTRHDYLSTFL